MRCVPYGTDVLIAPSQELYDELQASRPLALQVVQKPGINSWDNEVTIIYLTIMIIITPLWPF